MIPVDKQIPNSMLTACGFASTSPGDVLSRFKTTKIVTNCDVDYKTKLGTFFDGCLISSLNVKYMDLTYNEACGLASTTLIKYGVFFQSGDPSTPKYGNCYILIVSIHINGLSAFSLLLLVISIAI